MRKHKKVVVIGGGAAGFFGAITCAQMHKQCEVVLLEKSTKLLSKVRISGGGRCNVTQACFDNTTLAAQYPRGEKVLLRLFKQFTTTDTIRWFESRGVKLKTEADGRMFPITDDSETIIRCLLKEAEKANITIRTGTGVKSVQSIHTDEDEQPRFNVVLQDGSAIACDCLLIATGGNPSLASYQWLTTLGHTIQPPVPSLFTFNVANSYLADLAGISVPQAKATIEGTPLQQTGPLLITHWGFSGPAILKLSAWGARLLHEMKYSFKLQINWLPMYSEEKVRNECIAYRETNPKKIVAANPLFGLPVRLWKKLVNQAEITDQLRWAELSKKSLNQLLLLLIRNTFQVNGKSTFKDEFVTCGGVSLQDIDHQTMESRHCKGLYFAGEVLDVDGITGGYNFQNAWTTGYIAGKHMGL